MPNDQRPLKVFLCYAHSDKEAVRALYLRLRREGVDVWLDKEKLLPGVDWEYEIRKAVRESDVVIACLSKQFNQAGFRQKEVRIALDTAMEKPEGEVFIIPARLDECDSLESLSKWHWVDLFESDGFQRLIMALRIRANRIGATLRVRRGGAIAVPRSTGNELETKVKAEHAAVEKDRLQADELAKQKAAKEKAEQEKTIMVVKEETAKEEAEREATEKVAHEKAKREAVERAVREKTERRSVQIAAIKDVFSKAFNKFKLAIRKGKLFLGAGGIIGIVIILVWVGSWVIYQIPSMLIPQASITANPNATITLSSFPLPFTKTVAPSATPTISYTPTPTPTPRAITGDTFEEIKLLGKISPSKNESFTCADVSLDGQIIAIGSYNRDDETSSAKLWRTDNFTLLSPGSKQDGKITSVAFSHNGSLLASGMNNGTLIVWAVKTDEQIRSFKGITGSIENIGFSKDSRKLVASTSYHIAVWDIDTGELLSEIPFEPFNGPLITSFAVSSNNKISYTTGELETSWQYPPDPILKKPVKTPVPVYSTLYTMNYGNLDDLHHMQLLSSSRRDEVFAFFQNVLDFSQNDEMLLVGNSGQISILNLTNRSKDKTLPYFYNVDHGVFSPDNKSIVISGDRELVLWRISDDKVETVPYDDNKSITSLAFSQNGWILIAGSDDAVDVWGIPRLDSTPTLLP